MNGSIEIVALFLGFVSWVMIGISLHDQYWRESTQAEDVLTTSAIYENLWMSCASDSSGTYNCYDFPSMLSLPGHIQACRALMITSLVMGAFGTVATLVGMQCSKVGGENYVLKGRITGIGGMCFLLQGLCTMIAVSWYAFNITQEFFDPYHPGIKYEFGEGLYIGWGSSTLALFGGSLLLCACRLGISEEKMPCQHPTRVTTRPESPPSQPASSNYGKNAYV